MSRQQQALNGALMRVALVDALKKLDPRVQFRNPVMFVVWLGSLLTTLLALGMAGGLARRPRQLYRRYCALALVHRAVCQLRRSAGGRAQQGAGE
ncbi:hypothetical protein OJE16_16435 [Pantoea tagorei]